jgi:type III pantothenate kinase
MLLAIDSGNTNIVFAAFTDDGDVAGEWRAETRSNRTADALGAWLDQAMASDGIAKTEIGAAIVATVVPDNLSVLESLCRDRFGCDPLVMGQPGVAPGIDIRVDNPDSVGADRICNAVAAHQSYDGALLVVDFGTATTFDVIDDDGAYCGGIIYPGINLSLEALYLNAAQLPRVSLERPQKVIGTTTVGAIRSGVFWGHVAVIEGLIPRVKAEFGKDMTVVATGGFAPLFADATDVIQHVDPHLTLRGLRAIYLSNASR